MTEEQYISEHETYLRGIVWRFVQRCPEIRRPLQDDLMQEARIALLLQYRQQRQANKPECPNGIMIIRDLYTFAVNSYGIHIPRRKFKQEVKRFKWECYDEAADRRTAMQAVEESAEDKETLQALLSGLSETDRQFVRYRLEGWKGERLAQKMGVTQSSCYRTWQRVKRHLQKQL